MTDTTQTLEDRFWLYWGIAPEDSPKHQAGVKALEFTRQELTRLLDGLVMEEDNSITPGTVEAADTTDDYEEIGRQSGFNSAVREFNQRLATLQSQLKGE